MQFRFLTEIQEIKNENDQKEKQSKTSQLLNTTNGTLNSQLVFKYNVNTTK